MVRFEEHPITWGLIFANVIIFIVVFSLPDIEAAFDLLSLSFDTRFEVWRWISSMFMHVSASHLFFNMLGLFFFGKVLEKEVKPSWYLAIYFIGGLLGAFLYIHTDTIPVVGASAAVYAIMGAAMMLNPIKRIHFYLFPLPLGVVAISFVIVTTLAVFYTPEIVGSTASVAHIAHLGGLITGAMFALFYDPKRSVKGMLVLGVSVLLLIVLAPVFGLIAGFATIILGVVDAIVGFFLYLASSLLSRLWG